MRARNSFGDDRQTFERVIDDERERDDVGGEVKTSSERRRRVDVRHGQTPAAQDNVGAATPPT